MHCKWVPHSAQLGLNLNPPSHSGAPHYLVLITGTCGWVSSVVNFGEFFPNYLAQGACKTASYLHPVIEIPSFLLLLGALLISFTPDPRGLSIW